MAHANKPRSGKQNKGSARKRASSSTEQPTSGSADGECTELADLRMVVGDAFAEAVSATGAEFEALVRVVKLIEAVDETGRYRTCSQDLETAGTALDAVKAGHVALETAYCEAERVLEPVLERLAEAHAGEAARLGNQPGSSWPAAVHRRASKLCVSIALVIKYAPPGEVGPALAAACGDIRTEPDDLRTYLRGIATAFRVAAGPTEQGEPSTPDQWLGTNEAARRACVHPTAITRAREKGELASRTGPDGRAMIDAVSLMAWASRRYPPTTPEAVRSAAANERTRAPRRRGGKPLAK